MAEKQNDGVVGLIDDLRSNFDKNTRMTSDGHNPHDVHRALYSDWRQKAV